MLSARSSMREVWLSEHDVMDAMSMAPRVTRSAESLKGRFIAAGILTGLKDLVADEGVEAVDVAEAAG